ncbi:MAG: hypothetical protein AAB390_01250 [Patescibacteria group bacterium]
MLNKFLGRHPHRLSPLHHYQLGMIFSFVLGMFFYIVYLVLIENYQLEEMRWGWYYIIPWAIIYTIYCLHLRGKINGAVKINALKRPFAHWVILGISLIYFNVIRENEFQSLHPSLNAAFVLFSLFMADSYWDFVKTRNSPKG